MKRRHKLYKIYTNDIKRLFKLRIKNIPPIPLYQVEIKSLAVTDAEDNLINKSVQAESSSVSEKSENFQ